MENPQKDLNKAAFYGRSSNDASGGTSTASQLEAAQQYAKANGLEIVNVFMDNKEKGYTAKRPAFQELLAAITAIEREWTTLIAYDPTRIARAPIISANFDYLLVVQNIKLIYVLIPESDPISTQLMIDMHNLYGRMHQELSRKKGVEGQEENLRQGFWAGGSYPYGYIPQKIDTNIIRNGNKVYKTRLALDPDLAPKLKKYFELRSEGLSRRISCETTGIKYNQSTLHHVEKQAVLYCGHLIWRKAKPRVYDRRVGLQDAEHWQVYPNTCPRLITDETAHKILAQLKENSFSQKIRAKGLLSGFLETPQGERYYITTDRRVNNTTYRVKTPTQYRQIRASTLEKSVIDSVITDITTEGFINQVLASLDNGKSTCQTQIDALKKDIKRLEVRISNLIEAIVEADKNLRGELLEKLSKEKEKATEKERELELLQAEKNEHSYDKTKVKTILSSLFLRLNKEQNNEEFKVILGQIVGKIILDPFTWRCEIVYALPKNLNTKFEDLVELVLPRENERQTVNSTINASTKLILKVA